MIGSLVRFNDELEHLSDIVNLVVALHDILQVNQVSQDLEHLVPYRLRKMPRIRLINPQQRLRYLPVYLVQIFCHKQLQDKDVTLHVGGLWSLLWIWLCCFNEAVTEVLDPILDLFFRHFIRDGVEAADNLYNHDSHIIITFVLL